MISAALFGLMDEIPDYFSELMYPWHAESPEKGEEILEELLEKRSLPLGSVSSVVFGPLTRIRFMPHVAVIYGSPSQIAKIAKAAAYYGHISRVAFLGVAACSSITTAYRSGEPVISIPCSGELILGRTEEGELSIAFPIDLLDEIVDGLDKTDFIMPYPIPKFLRYEPMVPKEYKISYEHYLEWKEKRQ
jgi:uncharacterized protein (DUF169 family)